MKFDFTLPKSAAKVAETARLVEELGFDGCWVGETGNDCFIALAVAATATTRVTLGSGVAIAFARSPMTVAYQAHEIQNLSRGRLVLGLGSQIRAHVERRFSMPWGQPVARMRDYVGALHAIWRSWAEDSPLAYEGDFYRHTLMPPYFRPPEKLGSPPSIVLAGVNTAMTELAGEVADGYVFHPFTTASYLREVTLPALDRGRARTSRSRADFTVSGPSFSFLVDQAGRDYESVTREARRQVAFYASTPAYRAVLDHHGWGELQPALTALSRADRWEEMPDLIDDEVLSAFTIIATPADLATALHQRFGGLADRLTLGAAIPAPPAAFAAVVDRLQAIAAS